MNDLSAEVLACFARIEAAPHDPAPWSDLLYALATTATVSDVWAVVPLLARNNQNRIAHLMVLCRRLAEEGHVAVLDDLCAGDRLGISGVFLAVPRYYAARHAYLMDCALDVARAHYEQAVTGIPFAAGFADLKAEESADLWDLLRRILFSLLGVRPLDYCEDAPSEPDLLLDFPDLPESDLLIFAACDDAYCQSYAYPFLSAVYRCCPDAVVLIHVMNPTPEGGAVRWALRRDFPRCAFSSESCPVSLPLYAARRFMLAEPLRRRYNRDLLILDVDAVLTPEFMTDFAAVRASELALWRSLSMHSNDSGVYEAVVFAARGDTIAMQFFADATAWYRKTLARDGAFWCWDGYGLHYALARLGEQRSRVCNLAELWPDLSLGKAILPQQRCHTVPTMERAYGLFYGELAALLPPLLAQDVFHRLTGLEIAHG